jgi:hypothetical protein
MGGALTRTPAEQSEVPINGASQIEETAEERQKALTTLVRFSLVDFNAVVNLLPAFQFPGHGGLSSAGREFTISLSVCLFKARSKRCDS